MAGSKKEKLMMQDLDDTISMADKILKDVPTENNNHTTGGIPERRGEASGGDSGIGDMADVNSRMHILTQGMATTGHNAPHHHPNVPPLRPNRHNKEKIILNVGGRHFITFRSTLEHVPGTRLSDLDELDPSYDFQSDEYFFDRNPKLFSAILDFYRTGELHFAHCLCGPSIKKELDYWGINESNICNCCWRAYKSYEEEEETMAILDRTLSDGPPPDALRKHYCSRKDGTHTSYCESRRRLWDFLDSPQSSRFAQVWAFFMFILILVSIALACCQTHPSCRVPRANLNSSLKINITNPKKLLYIETEDHPATKYIDYVCILIFTIELLLRFFATPSKLDYFKNIYNIIDILCVVPMLVIALINLIDPNILDGQDIQLYLSVTSVLRVVRLFNLAKHYQSLKILKLAVFSSLRELLLLVLLISMGMLIFSTLIYFAEFGSEDDFGNIPIGFWWSIITMTTVGYGDMYPVSEFGYLVGGICAITGMLITGLPIPIIASNFNQYYAFARYRAKLSDKRIKHMREERLSREAHKTKEKNKEEKKARKKATINAIRTAAALAVMNNRKAKTENKVGPQTSNQVSI